MPVGDLVHIYIRLTDLAHEKQIYEPVNFHLLRLHFPFMPDFFTEKADSCSLNAVSFLKELEVGAVNSTGQLKVWDLRQHTDDTARTFRL